MRSLLNKVFMYRLHVIVTTETQTQGKNSKLNVPKSVSGSDKHIVKRILIPGITSHRQGI